MTIGVDKSAWKESCEDWQGHWVVWREEADPYRVKLVRSARR